MGVWVRAPTLRTTVLGTELSMPVMTAPCGGMRLVHPAGDLAVARGAAAAGTAHVASSASGYPLEEIAAAAGPQWFQLYRLGTREGMEVLVRRAQAAGYAAIVVTIDTPVPGHRQRDVRNGFTYAIRVNAANATRLAPQLLRRPAWVWRYWRDGMPFDLANSAQMSRDGTPLPLTEMANATAPQSLTWEDVAWVRANWEGPLVVKGVLGAEDARRAVDAGAEGVLVSNHGGRQLEGAPATIDVLPEVVAAVGHEAEVLLDSGVRRGGDVLKALALGARAVLVGRPYVWGLALGGQRGVEHVLGVLRSEMSRTMQLLGCPSVHDLDDSWLMEPVGARGSATAG
jgi:isopentenyl diphosphate isomerase/L-lactate dehydrogenase-like FMN-dependent dehydrogenase